MRINIGFKSGFLFFCLWLACVVGWGMNVYKLTRCDFNAPYKAEIVRGLGAFPIIPMGAIVGYLHIDDEPTVQLFKIVK